MAWWIAGYFLVGCLLCGISLGWQGRGNVGAVSLPRLLAIVALWPMYVVVFGIVAAFKVAQKRRA